MEIDTLSIDTQNNNLNINNLVNMLQMPGLKITDLMSIIQDFRNTLEKIKAPTKIVNHIEREIVEEKDF